MEMKETILKTFAEVFGDAEGAKAYFAPGRVNLIHFLQQESLYLNRFRLRRFCHL